MPYILIVILMYMIFTFHIYAEHLHAVIVTNVMYIMGTI